ncbi:ATP-dependent metallopeptidase FtsH/Yme1/Tma family protein [Aquibacillus saliphilus]|uniref:ATP-dependent metallopeptidase FtsH/Yme1/Tma family protein n=1 Tax=Aquibacillus saliphilus TaxID=1909422 RepID=UPI001CF0D4E0|nr:hypothetical protein [Aquibacillus saliphilus]
MLLLILLGLLAIIAIIFLFFRRSQDTIVQTIAFNKFLDYKTNEQVVNSKDDDKGVIDTINDFFDGPGGNSGGGDSDGDGGDDL